MVVFEVDRGELKYLQFEIGYVSEAICLVNEPPYFVVESFGGGIVHSVESPVFDDFR